MKNRVIKVVLAICACLLFASFIFCLAPHSSNLFAKGDSGFDSGGYGDYDNDYSGGGYSGGGSYDDGYYGGGVYIGTGGSVAFAVVAVVAILIIIVVVAVKNKQSGGRVVVNPKLPAAVEMDPETARSVSMQAYEDYVAIQKAWTKKDLESIRNMLTDEMYNMYDMQLETLRAKKQTNVMEEFKCRTCYVCGHNKTEEKDTIKLVLGVYCKDYIVDDNTGAVVAGDKNAKLLYFYELTYEKDLKVEDQHCPNCGASIKNQMSQTCPFCGTALTAKSSRYTLTNKKMLFKYKL